MNQEEEKQPNQASHDETVHFRNLFNTKKAMLQRFLRSNSSVSSPFHYIVLYN